MSNSIELDTFFVALIPFGQNGMAGHLTMPKLEMGFGNRTFNDAMWLLPVYDDLGTEPLLKSCQVEPRLRFFSPDDSSSFWPRCSSQSRLLSSRPSLFRRRLLKGPKPGRRTVSRRSRVLICSSMRTIRSTGFPGSRRRWPEPRRRTNRSFCRSDTAVVSGVT